MNIKLKLLYLWEEVISKDHISFEHFIENNRFTFSVIPQNIVYEPKYCCAPEKALPIKT